MWTEDGWKRITIKEASELHPSGTVSAHSGLFMCGLCGQHVLLTNESDRKKRHFRHSSSEKDKNCSERTQGSVYSEKHISKKHDLPIRITKANPKSFAFELGLIRAPIKELSEDFKIKIKSPDDKDFSREYCKERLNNDGITYLDIGERPFKTYHLFFKNGTEELRDFWPKIVKGINPEGTLFEKTSGKMLPNDSDVEIEKDYYLLKKGSLSTKERHGITIRDESSKDTWFLYSVAASEFNEDAAKFFLEYHCRLTNQPLSLQAVWPLFIEGDYVIKHNQDNSILLVKGEASSVTTFPKTRIQTISKHPTVYKVSCSDRMQWISVGRTSLLSKALQYTCFWKESIGRGRERPAPKIKVTDISGNDVESGEIHVLPKDGRLMFSSPYDGEVVVSHNGFISDKYRVEANRERELYEITWGVHISFYVGLDCHWESFYQKGCVSSIVENERAILKYITSRKEKMILAPHSLRNIALSLKRYPKVFSWIKKSIKKGKIDLLSYRKLQIIYNKSNMKCIPGGKQ